MDGEIRTGLETREGFFVGIGGAGLRDTGVGWVVAADAPGVDERGGNGALLRWFCRAKLGRDCVDALDGALEGKPVDTRSLVPSRFDTAAEGL